MVSTISRAILYYQYNVRVKHITRPDSQNTWNGKNITVDRK